MPPLPELQPVTQHAALWHTYDRSVKADLVSTAISTAEGTFLFDPIPLDPADLEQLRSSTAIRGIIVTNQNHWRLSAQLSRELAVPIFAHPGAALSEIDVEFSPLANGQGVGRDLHVITLDGAAPGEIALFCDLDHGIVVVGDALINFEPYGFALLPSKYCVDQKKMRQSLNRLLDYQFERMFFGHGLPLLAKARARLETLLNSA